ncbi:MAG TPA: FGGY family carbohydrate kinase [bacterium]|nr:FGGY family carbohydrate kinase [bacterium]
MSVLVIDAGTTNIKTIIFENNGNILSHNSIRVKTYYPERECVEHKPDNWWNCFVKGLQGLSINEDIESMAISAQGGTFLLLDKNLKPITNAFTWLDNRAKKISKSFKKKYGDDFFYKKTGHPVASWMPICIISYIRKKKPEIYANIGRVSFVADYLHFRLTGRFFLDRTNAQMSSFYNIVEDKWDENLCAIAGIDKNMLPEIIPSGTIGGNLKKEPATFLNLREGIPVVSGGHDQYCASLGAGIKEKGDCLLSTGTAFALLVLSDRLVFLSPEKHWKPGRYLTEGSYGIMAPVSNGCCVLDWITRNFKKFDIKKLNDTTIRFIPYLLEGKGQIKNISLSTKPEEIYYSAVKSIVYEIKKIVDEIESNIRIKKFFLVGGGTNIAFLPELIKQVIKTEVIVPKIKECAARGAFLLTKELKK